MGPAEAHLESEQLLHLVLGHAVWTSRRRRREGSIRVATEALWSAEGREQAFEIELGEDAPRRGDVEPALVWRSAREGPEGAYPQWGERPARRGGRVLRVQQHLAPHVEVHVPPGSVELCLAPACSRLSRARSRAPMTPSSAHCAAASPDPAGSGTAEGATGQGAAGVHAAVGHQLEKKKRIRASSCGGATIGRSGRIHVNPYNVARHGDSTEPPQTRAAT